MIAATVSNIVEVLPESKSGCASVLHLCGWCVMSMHARFLNNSPEKDGAPPEPLDAKVSVPGLALP